MKIYKSLFLFVLFIGISACNKHPTQNASPHPSPTVAVTSTVSTTPIMPTKSPTPTTTVTVTQKPKSEILTTETSIFFVSETITDGTQFEPGQVFTKTWTIRNNGKINWTTDYDFYRISSNPVNADLGELESIFLPHEVKPGEEIRISVDLIAPNQDGLFSVMYQLRNERGELVFGSEIWVTIRVGNAPPINPITMGNVSASLVGANLQTEEVSVSFCMKMPDSQAWYPWKVILKIGGQQLTPSGSRIDPATATTPNKCFTFSFPANSGITSGDPFQLSIGKVELPPEVHQAENCAYAQQVLRAAYPGFDFTCGGPGFWYTNLVTPPGMTAEEADTLILDAMSSAFYGPWNLNGSVP